MSLFLVCAVKTLPDDTAVTQPATCSFIFLLSCLPRVDGTCSWTWQVSRGRKPVYIHTNGFSNRKLKLVKACEMSKLNALEENTCAVNSEYSYCRIFRLWNMVVSFRKRESMNLLQWILVLLSWNHNKKKFQPQFCEHLNGATCILK